MAVTLVIPAHNEALRIERTLRSYRAALPSDVELVVVANGCTDDTAGVTRRVAKDLAGIALIDIAEPVGKGGAVRAGFAGAVSEWVGFVDADLATPPEDVQKVIDAARRTGAAIGSRWAQGSRIVGRTAGRDAAGRVFAGLVRTLLRLPFHDTQCGIKVFHRRWLAGYLAQSRVSDLAFDVELLVLLRDQGAAIAEVPTAWTAQPGSSTLGTLPGFVRHGAHMAGSILALWSRRRPPVVRP